MLISNFPSSGSIFPFDENILYTGSASYIEDGNENWRVKFLTSGTLTVKQKVLVDIFAVGGGGNGGAKRTVGSRTVSGCGGGGGYTKTESNRELLPDVKYTVTVGVAGGESSLAKTDGTILCQAAGGTTPTDGTGGDGGSGGGPSGYKDYYTGTPGSDGSDGTATHYGTTVLYAGGIGQGTTTREFGESDGDLYSGGGGGGYTESRSAVAGADGGGGSGASASRPAIAGTENTGGGGGGGGITYNTSGATGGTGIVIIRNTR